MVPNHMWQALIISGLIALGANATAQTPSGPDDTVWVAGRCGAGRTLMIQVRLANTNVYHTTLTICRRQRSQIAQIHWRFSPTPPQRPHGPHHSPPPREPLPADLSQCRGD